MPNSESRWQPLTAKVITDNAPYLLPHVPAQCHDFFNKVVRMALDHAEQAESEPTSSETAKPHWPFKAVAFANTTGDVIWERGYPEGITPHALVYIYSNAAPQASQAAMPESPRPVLHRDASDTTPAVAAPDTFDKELSALINRYSCENESNTPDFILAAYMGACLDAFDSATVERERWYGREPWKVTTGGERGQSK